MQVCKRHGGGAGLTLSTLRVHQPPPPPRPADGMGDEHDTRGGAGEPWTIYDFLFVWAFCPPALPTLGGSTSLQLTWA